MHAPCARVVYRFHPYIAVFDNEGVMRRAHGPFVVGAEPNLADCTARNEVRDDHLLRVLKRLSAVSPSIPATRDTLAAG